GDRIEFEADAGRGIAGAGVERGDDAGEGGESAVERVGGDLGARDGQAHEPGGGLAAADGEQVAAEAGVVGDDVDRRGGDDEDESAEGNVHETERQIDFAETAVEWMRDRHRLSADG